MIFDVRIFILFFSLSPVFSSSFFFIVDQQWNLLKWKLFRPMIY